MASLVPERQARATTPTSAIEAGTVVPSVVDTSTGQALTAIGTFVETASDALIEDIGNQALEEAAESQISEASVEAQGRMDRLDAAKTSGAISETSMLLRAQQESERLKRKYPARFHSDIEAAFGKPTAKMLEIETSRIKNEQNIRQKRYFDVAQSAVENGLATDADPVEYQYEQGIKWQAVQNEQIRQKAELGIKPDGTPIYMMQKNVTGIVNSTKDGLMLEVKRVQNLVNAAVNGTAEQKFAANQAMQNTIMALRGYTANLPRTINREDGSVVEYAPELLKFQNEAAKDNQTTLNALADMLENRSVEQETMTHLTNVVMDGLSPTAKAAVVTSKFTGSPVAASILDAEIASSFISGEDGAMTDDKLNIRPFDEVDSDKIMTGDSQLAHMVLSESGKGKSNPNAPVGQTEYDTLFMADLKPLEIDPAFEDRMAVMNNMHGNRDKLKDTPRDNKLAIADNNREILRNLRTDIDSDTAENFFTDFKNLQQDEIEITWDKNPDGSISANLNVLEEPDTSYGRAKVRDMRRRLTRMSTQVNKVLDIYEAMGVRDIGDELVDSLFVNNPIGPVPEVEPEQEEEIERPERGGL